MNSHKIVVYGIVLVLLAGIASALGVAPSRSFVDFEPDLNQDVRFSVVNNQKDDLKLRITVRGDLAEHVKLEESLLLVSPDESEKEIRLSLSLPKKIEKPGPHTIEIVVSQVAGDVSEADNAIVTALPSVVYKLVVRVPYPGKYAEGKMQVTPAGSGENTRFVIMLFNFGEEDIREAKAEIEISSKDGTAGKAETNTISIPTKKDGKVEALWLADVEPGIYTAKAVVGYDEKELSIEENFEVGSLVVDIVQVEVRDFTLGDVARFDIMLQSKWNQQIDDVYADITIYDGAGEVVGRSKTVTASIPPLSSKSLRAYWDTENIDIGEYDIQIVVYYAGKTLEKLIKAQVNLDSIRTDLSSTGNVVIGKGGEKNRDTFLIVLVVVLIAINGGWFFYFSRKKKRGEGRGKGKRK